MATIERDIIPESNMPAQYTDQAGIAVQNTCFHQSERASLSQLSSVCNCTLQSSDGPTAPVPTGLSHVDAEQACSGCVACVMRLTATHPQAQYQLYDLSAHGYESDELAPVPVV